MRASGWVLAALLLCSASSASAVVIRYQGPTRNVPVGEELELRVSADIAEAEALIGWGADLGYDGDLLELLGQPEVGETWRRVTTRDGDGLGGLAYPAVSGDGVGLFTARFRVLEQGDTEIELRTTSRDRTEGFALAVADAPGDLAEVVDDGFPMQLGGCACGLASSSGRSPANAGLFLTLPLLAMARRRWRRARSLRGEPIAV